jgi:hypothetical protein
MLVLFFLELTDGYLQSIVVEFALQKSHKYVEEFVFLS